MKAVVAAFNQEKALVGAFSVITNLRMDFFEALVCCWPADVRPHAVEVEGGGGADVLVLDVPLLHPQRPGLALWAVGEEWSEEKWNTLSPRENVGDK